MYEATCTEIRADGMQKWERTELPKSDQKRYIWLQSFQSKTGVVVGTVGKIAYVNGTGGAIGGHWGINKLMEII